MRCVRRAPVEEHRGFKTFIARCVLQSNGGCHQWQAPKRNQILGSLREGAQMGPSMCRSSHWEQRWLIKLLQYITTLCLGSSGPACSPTRRRWGKATCSLADTAISLLQKHARLPETLSLKESRVAQDAYHQLYAGSSKKSKHRDKRSGTADP